MPLNNQDLCNICANSIIHSCNNNNKVTDVIHVLGNSRTDSMFKIEVIKYWYIDKKHKKSKPKKFNGLNDLCEKLRYLLLLLPLHY